MNRLQRAKEHKRLYKSKARIRRILKAMGFFKIETVEDDIKIWDTTLADGLDIRLCDEEVECEVCSLLLKHDSTVFLK